MKKIGKFIKSNIKTVIAFTLGLVIAGGSAAVVSAIAGSQVTYTDTNNIGATTVQGAIDKLYAKVQNAGIDANSIDFSTLKTNTTKTVLASNKGVCINRNNKLNCFKINNWAEEQNHIQQVFSDISCEVYSSSVLCIASDFTCNLRSDGYVRCNDNSNNLDCVVNSDGSIRCR